MKPKIYTVGHSNKELKALVKKLAKHEIKALVDVRSSPYSRFNPQFNMQSVKIAVERAGVQYIWQGKNLGGLGKNIDFIGGLRYVITLAGQKNTCVMCSEADPAKCHRGSVLAPEFERRGLEVVHILWEEKKEAKKEKPKGMMSMLTLF